MFRRISLATVLAGTIAMAAMAPALAGEQRPYQASFSGMGVAVEQRCGPDALTLGFDVTGVATHMGRFTAFGTNCTEFTLATQAVAIWDGIIRVRAADGSTLTFSSVGHQDAAADGVAQAYQTLTVVSGTGRFDGAAGVLELVSTVDFATFTTEGTVSGWLSF